MKDWLRERPWWFWALGGVVVVLGAFAAGRFAAPTRVEERTRVEYQTKVEVQEVVREIKVEGPVRIVTRTRPAPEGPPPPGCPECPEIEEREETRGPTTTTTDTGRTVDVQASGSEVVERIVTRDAPRLTLAATIGAGFSSGGLTPPAYGVLALGRVAGPFVVGAQVEGNALGGSARLVAGLTF